MSRADDNFDDRPRRPRDDDYDDYDDRPRRGRSSGGGGGGGMGAAAILGIVVAVLFCCGAPVAIGLLLPAVQKVREAAARAADLNAFKQIALAFHNHEATTGRMPPADHPVSWRVHLLPYLEQEALYRQFDVKQPWDAAKNRPHASVRVPVYVSKTDDEGFVQTRARVFTGPGTLFPPEEPPLRLRGPDVKDGTSNTFLAVEATESVPWPQPRELTYTPAGPLPQLGHPQRPTGFIAAFADGSVKFVTRDAGEAARRSAVTATAGDAPPGF